MPIPPDVEYRLDLARRSVATAKPSEGPLNQIGYPAPETGSGYPPAGRGGGPAYGQTPFGGYEHAQDLSPAEARALEQQVDQGVMPRIANARSIAPSVRQQTQAELINLTLAYEKLGNPFSQRRLPFSVMRDMATDPMIYFAHHYTMVPLVRADWYMDGPDAQINSFVDECLRRSNPVLQQQ